MTSSEDCLIEIHTEELPPKSLLTLAETFAAQTALRLKKADLSFESILFFASPQRLALLICKLAATQPAQIIERKGPALAAAFTADGKPSHASLGFARSCGVNVDELSTLKNEQGEWLMFRQTVAGKTVDELMPHLIETVLTTLPIAKRMRWSDQEISFIRPIHSIILLYGKRIISGAILGFTPGRQTHGHRFHAPDVISIPHANQYAALLKEKGHCLVDFATRRATIVEQANALLKKNLATDANVLISSQDFLDEVTGLVEWPHALLGHFDAAFLDLPAEVLISAMQDHQRYFPIINDEKKLLPHFITISNIDSKDCKRVIHGNERVLRARLADAAFFYATDKKMRLIERVERLKDIIFQEKLGTLYDKALRVSELAAFIATTMGASTQQAKRAGLLGKTDLTTHMVMEFPELQGVMGDYYAKQDQEEDAVALAIKEQYLPRFAGDQLPTSDIGCALAIADRLDSLIGAFGTGQQPTGDKDPYGLRRAALGVLRILIEKKINLDLNNVLEQALATYQTPLSNPETLTQLEYFMQERLRAWYQDQGISADVFAAVAALHITNPLDNDARIKAVQTFKQLPEAEALSNANKRVSNILAKQTTNLDNKAIDPHYFEQEAEAKLAEALTTKCKVVDRLYQTGNYAEVLLQLAELRQPIDDFFDNVMVMTDDVPRRENRLRLLSQLRALFLQVADIALLQPQQD